MEANFLSISSYVLLVLCATCIVCNSSSETATHQRRSTDSVNYDFGSSYFFYQRSEYPKDCRDAQRQCSTTNPSGVYVIKPDGLEEPFEVFCNNELDTGGWTVIQRRMDGSVNFNRSWSEYENGFGFVSTEFWLGNKKISYLTNQAVYELRLDFELTDGSLVYVAYEGFRIVDEYSEYKITNVGLLQTNASSSLTTCPGNMVYGICTCLATCEDPNSVSGCNSDCQGSEGCTCPEGYLLSGSDCVNMSECACFVSESNLVVPVGEYHINDNCSRNCSCTNQQQLICEDDYSCDSNAACGVTNGVRQCTCNDGYEGDGQTCQPPHRDCMEVYEDGNTQDGIYTILPSGWQGEPFNVLCKMDNGGGWTVFQHRSGGSTGFYQNWDAYKEGFGDLNGDFWLGNEKLHYLTNQTDYKLRFDVTTSSGSSAYAEYAEFEIESEANYYRMNQLGTRSGNTGQHLRSRNAGKFFSTFDRDNDQCNSFNCAAKHRSGWWHGNHHCSYCGGSACSRFHYSGNCHSTCTADNLNGVFNGGNGVNIMSYHSSPPCNLRFTEMKIRPSS